MAGLRTSVRALQSALNPDADGTINPARVCLRSMCLEGLDGVDDRVNAEIGTNSANDRHLYVRTKDRSQTFARFSSAWDRFNVSQGFERGKWMLDERIWCLILTFPLQPSSPPLPPVGVPRGRGRRRPR